MIGSESFIFWKINRQNKVQQNFITLEWKKILKLVFVLNFKGMLRFFLNLSFLFLLIVLCVLLFYLPKQDTNIFAVKICKEKKAIPYN